MKPNGKRFLSRVLVFATFAVVCSALGQAETHGNFKLPTEVRWGNVLLAPGAYEFNVSDHGIGRVVTVRSLDSGWSGMILAVSASGMTQDESSHLVVDKTASGDVVRALYLSDPGLTLEFATFTGKAIHLAKTPSPTRTMTTASGSE